LARSGKENLQVEGWNVKITSDTKDLTSKDTQDIIFKVQDNPNVLPGKMAPGCVATATINLDLTGTKYPVDFTLQVDMELPHNFCLSVKIDGELYTLGEKILIEPVNGKVFTDEDGTKEIVSTLVWESDDDTNQDNMMGVFNEKISIPFSWKIEQNM